MASENKVQAFVHAIEEGKWALRIRIGVLAAVALSLGVYFVFNDFRGLSHAHGMEQAVVAREIASGNGFTTKMIRPAAYFQFQKNKGSFPAGKIPETYHAPLNPLLNAPFLLLAKSRWKMTDKDIVYACDRIIAAVSMACLLLAVLLNYFIAKRLFDQRLALIATGLLLICLRLYEFAMTGLPQMLMLLIFSGCLYAMIRAIESRHAGKSPLAWLVFAAFLFALLMLAHGLALWIFLGALLFTGIYFRPFGKYAAIMLTVFLLVMLPWWIYMNKASGSPAGISIYSGMFQIRGTEATIMRTLDISFGEWNPTHYRQKLTGQTISQINGLFAFLGGIIVAPVFLASLLHIFKRPETSAARWCVLCLWLGAIFGMSVFGMSDEGSDLQSNDLHVLFIPALTIYGLALVLVLWARLELTLKLLQYAFIALICLVSGLPMIAKLTSGAESSVHWPPYIPPYIAILNQWTADDEIIMSDMPWAVAWYADRKSLWLPLSINDFITLNDWNQLGGKVVGLYLTPVSGSAPFMREIVKGEYKEWAPFITRTVNLQDFPLNAVTPLPVAGECIFYADHDRWSQRAD